MKADGSLKSLLQGVSQQPTRDRLPGQCTEQINMSADPVRGLSRRAGCDLVGSLGTSTALGWANIKTQDGRNCIAKITSTGPAVYDYNATPFTVNISGSMSYWSAPGRWSVGSYKANTYFANEGVITSMRNEFATYYNMGAGAFPQGIIQILGGAYGKSYTVNLNGAEILHYKTQDGGEVNHAQRIGTKDIAAVIEWLLRNNPAVTTPPAWIPTGGGSSIGSNAAMASGWDVIRRDDIIWVRKTANATPFDLSINDDAGNINAKAMTDSVPDTADLPRWAPHNYVVRVAQETNPDEDLWLKFVSDTEGATTGGEFGKAGAWYEALAPGLSVGFNRSTMPRKMTFNPSTSTFTVGEDSWADRTVGTDVTNPAPSFVGYGVSDISTFQSRLVFVAGENLVATQSKKPDNFWIGSASTLVDTDPLDLTSQAAFSTALRWAVPHNKDLVIFSADGQFVLFGRQAVTPNNAALVLTTSFEADLSAKPVPSGRNVFFSTKYGRFTGMREFYTEGGTDINDTRPITQHVNSYIVGRAAHLSSTSNYDMLLVHTDADRTTVYPYQFIWSDSEKVQSAWHKWVFQYPVVYSFFEDELIYFVIRVGAEYFLLRMSLDITDEPGVGYPVHMDMRFDVSGVNTQFVLPYNWLEQEDLIVVQSTGCPYPGMNNRILDISWNAAENGYVVTLKDDMQGGNIVVGVNNDAEYEPTMPRIKDQSGDVIGNARLIVNQFLIALENTGRIKGQKLTQWGNGPVISFEGYIVNNVNSVVGKPALADETFRMPFKEKVQNASFKIMSDRHWPMTVLDIEWEGTMNKRGRRISTGE